MTKHTPGPWHVRPVSYPERAHPAVYDARGICVAHPVNNAVIPAPESDANGQLIAAAPDLLAALQRLLTSYNGLNLADWQAAVADGHAAIAKATGETPHDD